MLEPGEPDPGGVLDVAVLEDATPAAAALLRERLAPDGLAYLRLGARARGALARSGGLRLGPAVLELGAMLVPVERDALRFALGTRTASARGRLAALAPGNAAIVGLVAPAALARRPGARPLCAWLREWSGGATPVAAPNVVFAVGGDGLRAVAKVGSGLPARRELREADALVELGPAARAAGAHVPEPIGALDLDGTPVLIATGLDGRVAAVALAARRALLEPLLERLVDWLARWNAATAVEATLDAGVLERELLGPARSLPLPSAYREWLGRRCADAEGSAIVLVAAHNDLTTANVLVGRSRRLGIVDWDTAAPGTLPLGDLFYALADFQAASERFADRTAAFEACFAGRGRPAERASRHEQRLVKVLALDPASLDLCFHACWLRHAANEALRPAEHGRPFLGLVQRVAEGRIRMDG